MQNPDLFIHDSLTLLIRRKRLFTTHLPIFPASIFHDIKMDMKSNYKRRDFIKDISLLGMSLELIPVLPVGKLFSEKESVQLSNDFLSVSFNAGTGRIYVTRNDGKLLLNNGTARVNLDHRKKSIAGAEYEHKLETRKISDPIGNGRQLIISSKDREKVIDFMVIISLYDRLNAVFFEAICKNVSRKPVIIKGIEPVCAIQEIEASLIWQASSKALTNGPMYYDAGMLCNFEDEYHEPSPYGPIKGGDMSPDFRYPSADRIRSWWNVGIFGAYDKEGLVCGYIENNTGLGQIILKQITPGELSLYTESVFTGGTAIPAGQSISSGRFIMNIAKDTYAALEGFADIMGISNKARIKSIVNGWCSWFYTYGSVTEEEVIRNAEFASANLKKYGLDYIQVDEGYQRYHGDWEGNERFPHGMQWLSERIRSLGLKPGIWLSPFVISEPTEVFSKHPEWLLKEPDGKLMRVGPWPDINTDWAKNESPKRYGLDISHPGAQKWLFDLFDTVGNKWGFEMFKIDFVAWSLLSARKYYDTSYTPAMAYRKGFQIIRDAIGNEKHINDCGPGPVSAGLIDSMRIELDQNYGFADAAWQQYFLDSSSSGPAAAKRYYFNKRTWINDADHVCISLLSITQARAAASVIALSGGNVISGDRLIDLDNSRIEILKKTFPSSGEAAKPIDLFDRDRPSAFALKVRKSFGDWTIAGFFNAGKKEVISETIPLDRMWLDPSKKYIVYDFWEERLLGEATGNLDVRILPENVTLLAIHEKKGIPQFISTDRHILQGAIELDDILWDETTKTLTGISSGPASTAYNVLVYIPEGVNWHQDSNSFNKDLKNYSIKQTDPQVLKVHLRFAQEKTIKWDIVFNSL
jgi:hypothetical protein